MYQGLTLNFNKKGVNAMGITNSNKEINADTIDCTGTLKVTLSIAASPDITDNPADIVLILDRFGSMSGSALENLKIGANTFIDIIDEATDSAKDGQIGSGSRIGIVSFSSDATADTQLITSVADLKNAVNSLAAGGLTNHADAFEKAIALFDPASLNSKTIVMFTDGNTTTGLPPAPVAEAAKSAGIIIYCIGLVGDNGIDESALNEWASDPDSSYVSITPDAAELEKLFADLAANISKPGATDIVIDEIVNPDFKITEIIAPDKGTATQINDTTIKWTIDSLGVSGSEGAVLEFFIKHTAGTSGFKKINESITYSDKQGNDVVFPTPLVEVICDSPVIPEPCPSPVDITVKGCQDFVKADLGYVDLLSTGLIAEFSVTLKNVCPGKTTALAVVLTEEDDDGNEIPRGMKTLTVPAHNSDFCKDVTVKCIRFVLPDDKDSLRCKTRKLKARCFANYSNNNYTCCENS